MDLLPFDSLESCYTFERLCADILVAEGCLNVRGLGTGPDQGSDILIDVPSKTPLIEQTIPFVVQCKWYTDNTTVGQSHISEVFSYLSLHQAKGLLLITSSNFSGTAITKANAIDKDPSNPYHVLLWDSAEINRRIRRHPELIARYWYSTVGVKQKIRPTPDPFPFYDFLSFVSRFSPPPRYENVTIDTFPRTKTNAKEIEILIKCAANYAVSPPVVVIVTGMVGAGKTGFAYSLLNEKQAAGATIAGLNDYNFMEYFKSYELAGDERLPKLLACFNEVDFLLLDDFGYDLSDAVAIEEKAASTLVEIVRSRIKLNKPTIITTYDFQSSQTIRDYVTFLKHSFPVVDCGQQFSLRNMQLNDMAAYDNCVTMVNLEKKAETTSQKHSESFYGVWFTKDWLGEKLERIESGLVRAMHTLSTPTEDFNQIQKLHSKENKPISREALAIEEINHAMSLAQKYRKHIESLPWDAIEFTVNGPELRDRNRKES